MICGCHLSSGLKMGFLTHRTCYSRAMFLVPGSVIGRPLSVLQSFSITRKAKRTFVLQVDLQRFIPWEKDNQEKNFSFHVK